MSEIRAFFRHCPSCGRRFEIRLVSKKLLDEWKAKEDSKRTGVAPQSWKESVESPGEAVLQQGPAIPIDVEQFEYTYMCKHCGHKWSEERSVKIEEKPGTPTD
jgi:transcription elongation factor Elf1